MKQWTWQLIHDYGKGNYIGPDLDEEPSGLQQEGLAEDDDFVFRQSHGLGDGPEYKDQMEDMRQDESADRMALVQQVQGISH